MTEAEKEFHKNRLMWAFVNGELYWTYSQDGHKEWLDKTFGMKCYFPDTIRGYIRKDIDEDTIYIVAYKGDFNTASISDEHIKLLTWLTRLEYSFSKIEIYSGVEKGKPGEIWKPKQLVRRIFADKNDNKSVALIDLLTYEKFMLKLLDREDKYLSERRSIVNEYNNLRVWLRNYYDMNANTSNGLIKRAYLYSN